MMNTFQDKPAQRSCLQAFFRWPYYLLRLILSTKVGWGILLLILLVSALLIWWNNTSHTFPQVEHTHSIAITPESIEQVRQIEQWEFATIATEAYVDTVRATLLGTRELVRIYKGTLRLGMDMQYADSSWCRVRGDTVYLHLPPIQLLDSDFIDETATTTFYETGSWGHEVYPALLQRARDMMLHLSVTPQQCSQAEDQARYHFNNLFQALGFTHIFITITPYVLPY